MTTLFLTVLLLATVAEPAAGPLATADASRSGWLTERLRDEAPDKGACLASGSSDNDPCTVAGYAELVTSVEGVVSTELICPASDRCESRGGEASECVILDERRQGGDPGGDSQGGVLISQRCACSTATEIPRPSSCFLVLDYQSGSGGMDAVPSASDAPDLVACRGKGNCSLECQVVALAPDPWPGEELKKEICRCVPGGLMVDAEGGAESLVALADR
jgi:hypothetical protein